MRIRACALALICVAIPATALAETGILLLANRGTAEWNARVAQLVIATSGISEPDVRPWFGGVPYELAKTGLMPDDRLVDWVLSSAAK
jgi:hypothetical protein